eukprot:GHUV01031977.1.p1 GENE.GHUV01031977.1~~GHUV01031977.1.p1  ORF type:complete len:303 (-),score=31.63 GHUV01031977.1:148-1056(-)
MANVAEQMVSALAALQGQVAAVEQQLQQTQAHVAASASIRAGPRLPKPRYFTGKTRDTSVVNWAHQMETYIVASSLDINSPQAAVFAAGYLSDSALTWYRLHLQSVQQGRAVAFANWHQLRDEVVRCFQPIAPEHEAMERPNTLQQGRSVKQYCEIYSQCVLEIPYMSEGDRISRFLAGLKPQVRLHVELQHPDKLARAIELAIQVDSLVWQMQTRSSRAGMTSRWGGSSENRRSYEGYHRADANGEYQQPAGSTDGHVPMQCGAVTLEQKKGGKGMRCFNCNQRGYTAKLCPNQEDRGTAE